MTEFNELSALVVAEAAERSRDGWFDALCRVATQKIPAEGVGISLVNPETGTLMPIGSANPMSADAEALQATVGEGPCVDAIVTARPVLTADLDNSRRWPAFGLAAIDLGIRAAFAFPLQIGAASIGTLGVYRALPRTLSTAELATALGCVTVGISGVLDDLAGLPLGELGSRVGSALDATHVVYQAQGMVMVGLSVGVVEAMARMRAHAYAADRHLADIALDIVERRLHLERDA